VTQDVLLACTGLFTVYRDNITALRFLRDFRHARQPVTVCPDSTDHSRDRHSPYRRATAGTTTYPRNQTSFFLHQPAANRVTGRDYGAAACRLAMLPSIASRPSFPPHHVTLTAAYLNSNAVCQAGCCYHPFVVWRIIRCCDVFQRSPQRSGRMNAGGARAIIRGPRRMPRNRCCGDIAISLVRSCRAPALIATCASHPLHCHFVDRHYGGFDRAAYNSIFHAALPYISSAHTPAAAAFDNSANGPYRSWT